MNNLKIDLTRWTLPGATTPGQSRPESNDNEEVLSVPRTGASPLNAV